MTRIILWALGGFTVAAMALGAACSSGDDDDDATATGTTTGSGTTSCTCYSCKDYIAACLTDCPDGDPRDVVCDGSLTTLNALNQCICSPSGGDCEAACPGTCAMTIGGGGGGQGGAGGAPVDTDQCVACQGEAIAAQGPCTTQWDACYADSDCN